MPKNSVTAVAAAILLLCPAFIRAETITVVVGGGSLGEGQIKAIVEPFERETGHKVIPIKDQVTYAQLKLAEETKSQKIDVMSASPANGLVEARNGYIQNIDYKRFDPVDLEAVDARAKKPWGVAHFYFGTVLTVNSAKYPNPAAGPQTFSDLWNVEKFPGIRVMESGQAGDEGPWEEALLADGVPMDKLYPLDVDRVFRSLDKIKPAVRRWWTVGSEAMQLFGEGQATMGMSPDARVLALQASGKPVRIEYAGAKINSLYWIIPKGAPHPEVAQQFIAFAMRAKVQAEVANLARFAPTNQNAFQYIDKELARQFISYPANMKQAYFIDADWYATVGPDGKSNAQKLVDRWNQWILK